MVNKHFIGKERAQQAAVASYEPGLLSWSVYFATTTAEFAIFF